MTPLQNLAPLRWPSGPLEIAKREKTEGFDAAIRQTLELWHEPEALEVLKDTPIDCIVIGWAAGLPEDAAQQGSASRLLEAARRRNLAVVGWVEGAADPRAAMAAAKTAGLAAVAMANFTGSADLPVIAWADRAGVPWDSEAAAVAITGNVWPGVSMANDGADATSGPTSVPWLDSNSWYIQMASARLKPPLWVMFDPPGKGAVVPGHSYVKAICDSAAGGGRWVISLDDHLRAGLAARNPAAEQSWKQIAAAARFFKEHAEWKSYRSLGLVGVISDYTGGNFELSGEILNLMSRRDLLFRAIWKSQVTAEALTGLKVLVYADAAPLAGESRRTIADFVEQGGLLVTGPEWPADGQPAPPDFPTELDVRALGNGRLALARKGITDPYQVAIDTQLLLSHRNDLVKIYNSGSSGCTRFTAAKDGRTALLQCLSYADRGGLPTIWVRRRYRSTRLWTIEARAAALQPETSEEYAGVEYHLPANSPPYLALEFQVEQGAEKG